LAPLISIGKDPLLASGAVKLGCDWLGSSGVYHLAWVTEWVGQPNTHSSNSILIPTCVTDLILSILLGT